MCSTQVAASDFAKLKPDINIRVHIVANSCTESPGVYIQHITNYTDSRG